MLHAVTFFAAETSAAHSEKAEGISALGINGTALLIQLVTFVLVYFVLRKWAFGPIVAMLQKRRETIEQGVNLGETMKADKAKFDKQVAKELKAARVRADEIVAQAEANAKDVVKKAEDDASSKAATIIAEGKQRGEQEVARARKALEAELVSLVSDATEAIISEKVDANKDAQLIERALKGQQA